MTEDRTSEIKQTIEDRVIQELNTADIGSPAFDSAVKHYQHLLNDQKDPELVELEKEQIRAKIARDRAEAQKGPELFELEKEQIRAKIARDRAEAQKIETPDPWYIQHADKLIFAGASVGTAMLMVCVEHFGPTILNSKAWQKMPSFKFGQ